MADRIAADLSLGVACDVKRVAPTSQSQRALWVLCQVLSNDSVYNEAHVVRMRGMLDVDALARAVNEIGRRHEALRTCFRVVNGEPMQEIAAEARLSLEVVELSAVAEEEREAEARRRARDQVRAPFDLERGPLTRVRLLRMARDEHWLVITRHHLIGDGTSSVILARELSVLYNAYRSDEPPPLQALPAQYADYALRQREWLLGKEAQDQLAYWKQALADLPTLELATDRPRPAVSSCRGGRVVFELEEALTAALKELRRQEGTTLFTTLLAALQVLLYRYSGQQDIAVGVPVAGRRQPEFSGLIGYFVNVLVLRGDLSGDPTFRDYLAQVKRRAQEAYAHQELPFAKVVEELAPERDPSRNPLFQVSLVKGTEPGERPDLHGLLVEDMAITGSETAKFDLSFSVAEEHRKVGVAIDYATDLFDAATIERMADHWRILLEDIVEHPERPVSRLRLLDDASRRSILVDWNATRTSYPAEASIAALFAAQVRRTPSAVALIDGARVLDYSQLDRLSRALARRLRAAGVSPGSRVGVCIERSLEEIVALVGVLDAGCAYVPLDPTHPPERLAALLADAQAAAVIAVSASLQALAVARTAIECPLLIVDQADLLAENTGADLPLATRGEDPAYVMYTSGSTGMPKGVVIPQRAVVRLVLNTDYAQLDATDVVAHLSNPAFDAATFEVWGALLNGARLVVIPRETVLAPDALGAAMDRYGVTTFFLTTALFHPVARTAPRVFAGRQVFFGGEAAEPRWVAAALREGRPRRLVNLYGPTEATTFATWHEVHAVEADAPAVPIGRPIANTEVYILDASGEPLPPGVPGEIWIGGPGLALGYLDAPQLTAERFLPHPFSSDPGARLYRAGDRARYRDDGTIEFLGRFDSQIKLRGHRIEPSEIEHTLKQHDAIEHAVVLARQDRPGEKRLVAYVVPERGGAASAGELRAYLLRRLPEYMVPAAFVILEALPLTATGKVDRNRLPVPGKESFATADERRVPPRGSVEEKLAAIFCETLGLDRVGAHGDFFELGGDSLLAMQILTRVNAVFGVTVSVPSFFADATVAQVARTVEAQRQSHAAQSPGRKFAATRGCRSRELRGRARAEMPYIFPLSFAQQQLWVLDRLLAGRPVYNVSTVLRLEGALDSDALQRALAEIVSRHETLRTRFETEHGSPVQVIAPQLEFALEMEELGMLPASEREAEARRRAHEASLRPFDLQRAPLFRARLLRLGELEHWLLLTLHHIVSDGWSSGVLQRELSLLYEALRDRRPSPLPELPVQYADYALWQRDWLRGEAYEKQLGFWKQALAGLPVLELPADRPRPTAASYRGGRVRFVIAEDLTRRLKDLGRRERATLFMTLVAVFQVLLHRYSGQEDIAVGVPIAGRARPELEGLIGYFVNMLVLRGDLSGEPRFVDCLARVRERALAAYSHQDVPFAKLVEELAPRRDASRNPLFQVCFGLENVPVGALRLPGLSASVVDDIGGGTAKFDLDFSVTERLGKLDVVIEYPTDLFDARTIERMAKHWKVLLEGIVANPQQRIADLPLLPQAERQLLVQWNATAVEYPEHRCIHELFEEQAQRTPQATAVVFDGQELSYAELDARANRLAQHLQTLGVGPEVLVAIAMERSAELVVGLLGILKAGGAYVPLDPSYPAARLALVLADTQAPLLLTQQRLRGQLPAYAGRTLYMDCDWESIARQPCDNSKCTAKAGNLAYVMYTSGSTGQPKGVMVEHRSVVNYLSWLRRAFPLAATDRVLQKTPVSFDASIEEIFFPLTSGAVLVIAGPAAQRSVAELVGMLKAHRITVLQVVPSLLLSILEHADLRGCDALRLILCGAEILSRDLVRRLREQSRAELLNLYGPTETTVSSTFWRCQSDGDPTSASAPIGRPIANTHVMILDRSGQLLPHGVPGELCIGGAGVARGYLHRPELTAQRFVPDPLSSNPQARLYKTGDIARHRPDGTLEFLGRRDQQVKIRGYRIELGEIEAMLKQHVAVQDAVVLAREGRPGEKRLVAYTVAARARSSPSGELREFLLSRLPDYMVPAAFVNLNALPLTAHGKVDRVSLAAITPEFETGAQKRVAPRNAVEVQLMRIWEQVLDVSPIGMQDNFFALGGDSLGAVRVIDRIEQLFGRQLPPDLLWYQEGTIESLARALLDESGPPVWSGAVPIKTSGKRRPLFCPHIVGGHLFFYDNLARHLDEDQPLYGLPARGFDGRTPPDSSIEAMAAHCIRNMRLVQPRGPYRLAGYCSGAYIAFEMARQLCEHGDPVELLALCDSLAPGFHPLELARMVGNFLRLKDVRLVQQRVYRFVLENLRLRHLRVFRTVSEAHYWAFLGYRPRPYSGGAVLLRPTITGASRSPGLGWERLVRGGVDICLISTGHAAMVREPVVRILAEKLETYLSRIVEGSGDRAAGPAPRKTETAFEL